MDGDGVMSDDVGSMSTNQLSHPESVTANIDSGCSSPCHSEQEDKTEVQSDVQGTVATKPEHESDVEIKSEIIIPDIQLCNSSKAFVFKEKQVKENERDAMVTETDIKLEQDEDCTNSNHEEGHSSGGSNHCEPEFSAVFIKTENGDQPVEVPSAENVPMDLCLERKAPCEFVQVGSSPPVAEEVKEEQNQEAEPKCLTTKELLAQICGEENSVPNSFPPFVNSSTKGKLSDHMNKEQNQETEQMVVESCRQENAVTNSFSVLDNNSMKVMGVISCDSCGVTFTSDIYLQVHRRICRGQRKLPEVVDLEKIPPDIQYLAQIRDGKKIYSCHLCAYETPRGGHMTRHMLSHMGARPYICTECNKGFTQSEGLALHRLTHLKVKPFSCTECPFSSARPAALRRHMATHTGEVMFACPHCEYKTAQKYNLKTHVRIHLNDKPYKCSHCEYRAIWKSSVEKHEISVHSTEKTAVCMLCDKKFKLKEELKRHVLRRHSGEVKVRKKRVLKKKLNVKPTKPKPTKPKPTKLEPTNLEPTKPEPTKPEPTNLEPTNLEPTNLEPSNLEPTILEPTVQLNITKD